ncbi:MAG: LPS assembly lipoprotein LptE [Candidatus Thioglobus sp.]|uniref:LPS assembly lipoprotein LptE n=1 Tax=Candidatus Thioglobus sp. TaxID=2026721 RepID=UPI002613B1F6|nr:LPS assembly lipoprotein LptE [Candidatus Thioglobus sp.]MDC9726927.1 LPS assembly lipoprotein LptE [Candidatus Thioglobus sp.]
MLKIALLPIILATTLLSSCGFHAPVKNTTLNATITSDKSNAFAAELETRFNQEAAKNLSIQIGAEVKKQQTASYTTSNTANSYTLSLSVPVKVFNADNKLLLSQDLAASMHLSKVSSAQADRLQIEESYTQLRNTVIKKLIRRLSKLNEN